MTDTIDKFEKHRDAAHVQRVTQSSNDEGVTLPEGTISMHGNDVTIMFGARKDAEAAFEVLESAITTPKPEGVKECATEGCEKPATVRFERHGVGSDYCRECYLKVQALRSTTYGYKAHPETDWGPDVGAEVLPPYTQPPTPASGEPRHIETRNDEAGFTEFVNQDGPTVVREIDGRVAILLDMDTRDVVGYRVYDAPVASREQMEVVGEADEAYEIGKREGYEQAVQDIDLMTGGDGEYRFCTDHDPDRHTPDAATMKQRIADRFTAANERAERAEQERGDFETAMNRWHNRCRDQNTRAENAEALNTTLSEALETERTWHEEQDKSLSKQPSSTGPNGTQWARLQHQERIAEINTALAALPAKQGGQS